MWTVTGFTFKNKAKSKSFVITSIILALLLTIAMHLPIIIQWFISDEPDRVGVTESDVSVAVMLDDYFNSMEDAPIQIAWLEDKGSTEANLEAAEQRVEAGDIEAYLHIEGEASEGSFPVMKVYTTSSVGQSLMTSLQGALDFVKTSLIVNEIGLAQEDLYRLNTPVQLTEETFIEEEEMSPSELIMAYILVYALTILIFFSVIMNGNMIAAEITAEKSSRVMEILVSSVSPVSQMFGKVIGMFLLSMLQIGIFFGVIVLNLLLPHNQDMIGMLGISLSDLRVDLLIYFILFFVLGYLIYAMVFAGIGSIVSRTEDLGQALMPVTFLSLGGFYITMFGMNAADSTFVIATSYIPFFTPFVMFLRIGLGGPVWWEIWLSIGIMVVSVIILGWIAAKIYRTGVLMYGKRPSMKELRKAMKSYKV